MARPRTVATYSLAVLTRVAATGFGCLRDVSADLTPVHAFIGPNDSGKSTLLRAIQTVSRFGHGDAGITRAYLPAAPSRLAGTTWLTANLPRLTYELLWDDQGQVSLVTRSPETGTKVTPMTKTKNFEQRKEVYALGELWLSFADGIEESELVG